MLKIKQMKNLVEHAKLKYENSVVNLLIYGRIQKSVKNTETWLSLTMRAPISYLPDRTISSMKVLRAQSLHVDHGRTILGLFMTETTTTTQAMIILIVLAINYKKLWVSKVIEKE